MEYVSPFDERVAPAIQAAPGLEGLAGKRLVLFDITKRKSREFLEALEALLTEEGAETVRLAKATYSRPAAQAVIDRAVAADGVIEALAD